MVLRIKSTLPKIKFDNTGYTKAVRNHIEIQFRHAMRAFVKAAYPKIPVWTGMARGSLTGLADELGVKVPIAPIAQNEYYYLGDGEKIPKTPASGRALTYYNKGWQGHKYNFEISTDVKHLQIGEVAGSNSPPWQAYATGLEAFRAELQKLTQRSRFPRYQDFISVSYYESGEGSNKLVSRF